MKTLGVVGGIGPDSTVDYYLSLMKMWREKTADGTSPSILINSIDLTKLLGLIAAQALPELAAYLSAEVERLARAGAGAGLIAANTPHIVFDEVQRLSSIPLNQHSGGCARGRRRTWIPEARPAWQQVHYAGALLFQSLFQGRNLARRP